MNAMRMSLGRAVLAIVAAFAAALAVYGSGALAETAETGNPSAFAGANFAPRELKKNRFMPGTLTLSTHLATVDGSHVPALRELLWEFDRNVRLDLAGVPVCRRPHVAGPNPGEECGNSIVGRGMAQVEILFEESHLIQDTPRVMLYNSGPRDGIPTLFARMYITNPVPSSIILPIRIEPIRSGPFRTAMVIMFPKIAGGNGSITELSMRLHRRVLDHRRFHSFVFLRCLDGGIEARSTVTFADGTTFGMGMVRPCSAHPGPWQP